MRFRGGRLPGMTRKAAQLCSEPGHLLDNFKAYVVGLRLRDEWRKAGHDQKASKLIDAGRRLSSTQLVCFGLAFRDIMSGVVAPWVLAVQKTSMEPWVVQHHWKEHEKRLIAAVEALSYYRDFVRILVLLRQWVPASTLRNLAKAVFYAGPSCFFVETASGRETPTLWGRSIPSVVFGVADMLHTSPPTFHGVELICVQEPWQSEYVLLGPHCQCPFLRPGRHKNKAKVNLGKSQRKVNVPCWVSEGRSHMKAQPGGIGDDVAAVAGGDALVASIRPCPADIRWKWVQKGSLTLARGVSPERRFRPNPRAHASHCSSCIVSPLLPQLLLEVDSALAAAMAFLRKLLHEECQLFGPEGMSTGMAKVTECIGRCFDWGRLVHSSPTVHDVNSFYEAYQLLSPFLRHTEWPSQEEFPLVVHGWPDRNTMCYQYSLLMRRVRLAAPTKKARDWWQTIGFRVVPVVSYVSVIQVLGPSVHKAFDDAAEGKCEVHWRTKACFLYRIASVVSTFLGRGTHSDDALGASGDALEASGAPKSFIVSPSKLARVGFPWKGRQRSGLQKRVIVDKWAVRPAEPGGLATLVLAGSVGKLVYIDEHVKELDWSAVSAAIDTNPHFSRDGPSFGKTRRSRMSTWHAARMHHQCRMLGVPEACCERTGSVMKRLWQKNTSIAVSALMDLTSLAAAGVECCGTERDEQLCQAVADCMTHMGRAPTIGKRTLLARQKDGVAISRAVSNYRADAEAMLREEGRGLELDMEDSSCSDEGIVLGDGGGDSDDEVVSNSPKRARATAIAVGDTRLCELSSHISKRLKKGKPAMILSEAMQGKLAAATAQRVSALPLRHERGGSKDSARAPSAVKSRMLAWLECDLGKEWKAQRDQRIREAYEA